VTKEIFHQWYHEDVPGKRILIKSDGGPGRTHLAYLSEGHYPGLPNGNTFLDQIFALLKTLMEMNRQRIWNVKFEIDGQHARVGIRDLGYILFGGEYTFSKEHPFISIAHLIRDWTMIALTRYRRSVGMCLLLALL